MPRLRDESLDAAGLPSDVADAAAAERVAEAPVPTSRSRPGSPSADATSRAPTADVEATGAERAEAVSRRSPRSRSSPGPGDDELDGAETEEPARA